MDDVVHKQAQKAARHIARSTGANVMISGDVDLRPMMSFLKTSYGFVPTEIDGAAHVFFSPVVEAPSAKAVRKHGALIAAQLGRAAVYMLETITKTGLEKLVGLDVAFVVPGRHLHLPGRVTAIGTRFEHIVDEPMTPPAPGALGPTAQAMLIRHLLRNDEGPVPSMMLAASLGVTSMTALAAANELVAAGLARRTRSGHVGSLDFVSSGRDLFERALHLLQSPVLLTQHYSGAGVVKRYMQGGETALARMTNLAEPSVPVFATSRRNRLGVAQRFDLQPCHRADADMTFEVWRYAPEATRWPGDLVDPLSLHLQFIPTNGSRAPSRSCSRRPSLRNREPRGRAPQRNSTLRTARGVHCAGRMSSGVSRSERIETDPPPPCPGSNPRGAVSRGLLPSRMSAGSRRAGRTKSCGQISADPVSFAITREGVDLVEQTTHAASAGDLLAGRF